jgi:hypothetical protein
VLRRHKDRRMRFIHEGNVALLGIARLARWCRTRWSPWRDARDQAGVGREHAAGALARVAPRLGEKSPARPVSRQFG